MLYYIENRVLNISFLFNLRRKIFHSIYNHVSSSNIHSEKNVPELRFPEFTDAWQTVKLKDIVDRITRKNKNLETERPLTISAKDGLIDQIEFFDKYVASKNLKGYYYLKKGEFAYNKSYSNGYPYGTVKRLDYYNDGAVSTLYICFEITDRINSDFLKTYFETNKWYKEMYKIAVEGARNHGLLNIAVNDFFNTKHKIPTKQEQEKIASFLSAVDKKIECMETKIKCFSSYIQFSQKLIMNPSNDLVKVRLRDVCRVNKGKQLNKSDMVVNGKYYVLNGGMSPSGYTNSYNVSSNTISISEGGNSCGFVNFNTEDFYCGGHCFYLELCSDVICTELLYYCLKLNERNIMHLRVGSGLPNIQKKDLENFTFSIPRSNQQLLVDLLGSLMKNYDLICKKLGYLKDYKKGLLQRMFC